MVFAPGDFSAARVGQRARCHALRRGATGADGLGTLVPPKNIRWSDLRLGITRRYDLLTKTNDLK